MADIFKILQQAQQMQGRLQAMQEELQARTVTASSGGGMVSVEADGKGQLRKIKIDPSLVVPGEVEMLEDLIVAATNDAKAKLESQMQDEMGKLTGGLPLPPGFKLPF